MPVEFSVAAFRFGHSMIRPYTGSTPPSSRRPIFRPRTGAGTRADDAADPRRFRPIPGDWAIDWRFFIDLGPGASPGPRHGCMTRYPAGHRGPTRSIPALVEPAPRPARRIASNPFDRSRGATSNAGKVFQLPSGQAVARALGEPAIPDEELLIGAATGEGQVDTPRQIAPSFAGRAPLWAYILSEAQVTSLEKADSGASPG